MVRSPLKLLLPVLCFNLVLATAALPKSNKTAAGSAPKVKVVKVADKTDSDALPGMGSISCAKTLELGFDESGLISEILVQEGDAVQKNQVLARLDDAVLVAQISTIRARMRAAQAEASFLKNELGGKEQMFRQDALSETEVRKASFEVEKAEAAVALAQAELEMAEVRRRQRSLLSPVSGIVTHKYVELGSVIMPGSSKVVRIVQCSETFANLELGERLFPLTRIGGSVSLEVDAVPGTVFQGRVVSIGPEIDKKNRTFVVKVSVDNPRHVLRPGMFVRAKISTAAGHSSVTVPAQALLSTGSAGSAVFVVRDGVALRRPVTIGTTSDSHVQVVRGLEPGDLVVVEGQQRISDLMEVSPELTGQQQ